MESGLTVILPMRAGSKRVLHKNVKPLGPFHYGLTEIKLRQLVKTPCVDEILVSTDLPEIEAIVERVRESSDSFVAINVKPRDPWYCRDETTTDELIPHLMEQVNRQWVLWTHVTSPFFGADSYQDFHAAFMAAGPDYDSAMTVTAQQEFLWDRSGPINYNREERRWPHTQGLPEQYLVNSAAFLISKENADDFGDRIGDKPYLHQTSALEGFDVDWQDQWDMVNVLAQGGYSF